MAAPPIPLVVNQCGQCYGMPPECVHGQVAATACSRFTPAAAGARNAQGQYSVVFNQSLPSEVRSSSGAFIDSLTNYQLAAPAAYAAGTPEAAIHGGAGGVTLITLSAAISVCRDYPALLRRIHDEVTALFNAAPNQAEVARINGALAQINHVEDMDTRKLQTAASSATPTQLQEKEYPLATLFQVVVRSVEKGLNLHQKADEMLDVVSGKRYVPFVGQTKCSSGSKLIYSLSTFIQTCNQVQDLAPSVYRDFYRTVMLLEETDGHVFAQEMVDATLRQLDERHHQSIVSLMASGAHHTIVGGMREARMKAKTLPIKDQRFDPNHPQYDPRSRINFGKVDDPVGGKGAGIITNYKNGDKVKCNRFHAKPQKPCTAGVPREAKYKQSDWGLCAYDH